MIALFFLVFLVFFRETGDVKRLFFLSVAVCVQWPEGRCFHDVPEPALLNLYFEIRENCHGFS